MKRLAIIGSVGIPVNHEGFETLTENLVEQLSYKYEITVFCSTKDLKRSERKSSYKGARLKFIPLKANGLQGVLYYYIAIFRALFYADTLLILGVSGCTMLPLVRLFTRKKIIVNIDGLEWRRKKWGRLAKWFLRLSEGFAIRYSHVDVVDNKAIQRYTTMYYGTVSKVIPYGGNHKTVDRSNEALMNKYPFVNNDYFIKVAPIEPENNIELILRTFSVEKEQLVIVGDWSKSEFGKALYKEYGSLSNIQLLNPIYELEEIDFLRGNAKAYIHGREAGGTNPSLVQAMCLGLPVISFNVSFNRETTKAQALYFGSENELKAIIKTTLEKEYIKNKKAMLLISHKEYTWKRIAEQYDDLIEWLRFEYAHKMNVPKLGELDRIRLRSGDFEQIIAKH
ncbi:MAG: DUF1972 domain-containing protein [Crocinitomicaceae bacterium]|nr:DUF1972 domain-containing protein [Crocinitomicaceae bacterium]